MSALGNQRHVVAVLVLGLAGAIGLAVVQLSRLGEATSRIDRLEQHLDELLSGKDPDRLAPGGTEEPREGLAEIDAALESLGKRLDALLLRTTSNTRRLDYLEAGDIEDLGIEAFIEQRIGAIAKSGKALSGGQPDLDRVAQYLNLSAGQQAQVAEIIDRSKDELRRVMESAHRDGSTLSDSLGEIVSSPLNPRNKIKRMSELMFSHGPPGSEDNYMAHVMDIRVEALDAFQGTLTADQHAKWKGMGYDLFAIQTGYAPFKDAAKSLREETP